jgi:hypothetical protein
MATNHKLASKLPASFFKKGGHVYWLRDWPSFQVHIKLVYNNVTKLYNVFVQSKYEPTPQHISSHYTVRSLLRYGFELSRAYGFVTGSATVVCADVTNAVQNSNLQ